MAFAQDGTEHTHTMTDTYRKTIRKLAENMTDILYIAKIAREGLGGDLAMNDYAITTHAYDGSVFQVDMSCGRNGAIEPNPYTARVVKSEKLNITKRASDADDTAWDEKRIRVNKLSLISWDSNAQKFPIISSNKIMFREQEIDFKNEYRQDRLNAVMVLGAQWANDMEKDNAKECIRVLDELMTIPPFKAFYDSKYGFLVKRKINFTRIVEPFKELIPAKLVEDEINKTEQIILASAKSQPEFKRDVIAEAVHPKRIDYLINKHGIEEGMAMFD